MKNLLFLLITISGFSLFYSCGEENFEPYDNNSSSKNLELLPSEITKSYKDPGTGNISTTQITMDYNSQNQIISIQETLTGGYKKTYDITYNAEGNNITEVLETSANSTATTYTYEYVDSHTIKEHVSTPGAAPQTHTLTLNSKLLLASKQGPDIGLITYGYDTAGNLISENSSTYLYDDTKGWMHTVRTPLWLFYSFGENFPGTYNLINNVTKMGTNVYNYVEFNPSKYPVRVTINNDTELTIKYTFAK